MIMDILTGSGGDSVLFARYTGGDSVLVNKKEWGDSVQGGFCPTLLIRDVNECRNWYSNIRIGYSNIFEYSNDIHTYAQKTHYDD